MAGAAWRIVSIKAPKDNSSSRLVGSTIGNQRLGCERSTRRRSPLRTRVQGWVLWPLGEREAEQQAAVAARRGSWCRYGADFEGWDWGTGAASPPINKGRGETRRIPGSTRRGVPGWTRRGVESAQAGAPTSGHRAGSPQAGELQCAAGELTLPSAAGAAWPSFDGLVVVLVLVIVVVNEPQDLDEAVGSPGRHRARDRRSSWTPPYSTATGTLGTTTMSMRSSSSSPTTAFMKTSPRPA
jgi:hypothetical protein